MKIKSRSSSRSKAPMIGVLIFIALAAAAAFLLLRDLKGPEISLGPDNGGRVSPNQVLTVTAFDPSGIRSIAVTVRRGEQSMQILDHRFEEKIPEQSISFTLKDTQLPEGAFELEIEARDASYSGFGRGNGENISVALRMDTQPPRIAVKTVPPGLYKGGSALIVYTVSEDVRKTGVGVGDYFFPGYRQENGGYACLFTFPYTMSLDDFVPEIMAEDLAGNIASSKLMVNARNTNFKQDSLTISDNFLNTKAADIDRLSPIEGNLLEHYLYVNSVVRIANDDLLYNLRGQTALNFIWSGSFAKLPSSAERADFGDQRTYTYSGNTFAQTGEVIDHQVHTGLDLASVAQAPVPASNNGVVLYADDLGIYGNLVIIDHGMGLMSLYSHLTDIYVQVGEAVEKNQLIGTTGTTGLAVGDHVHFGLMVGGIHVNPREWLDNSWVNNNITTRLNTPIQ